MIPIVKEAAWDAVLNVDEVTMHFKNFRFTRSGVNFFRCFKVLFAKSVSVKAS